MQNFSADASCAAPRLSGRLLGARFVPRAWLLVPQYTLAASDVEIWSKLMTLIRVICWPQFFLTADVTVILCPQPRSHRSEMPSIHLLETRNKMRMDGTYVEDLKGAQVIDVHVLCAG